MENLNKEKIEKVLLNFKEQSQISIALIQIKCRFTYKQAEEILEVMENEKLITKVQNSGVYRIL